MPASNSSVSEHQRGSSAEQTLRRLRGLVLDGQYGPGSWLNEAALASALNVGRGPVRESLQALAIEGLVVRISNRGAFVANLDAADLRELYEVREALEVMAAGLAAERASINDIASLRKLLDQTAGELAEDGSAPYPQRLDLHEAILSIPGNGRLLQRAREVHGQLRLARSRSAYRPARAKLAYDEHTRIVEAVAVGDANAAKAAMCAHMRTSLAHVQAIFAMDQRHDGWPATAKRGVHA